MNLKMGSRIIAATGIAALLFALAACNQPNNASKGTQGQSTQTSKDELSLKDKVSNSLTSAVATLNAKKITLDLTNKKFTIEAASTATELSAKDIFTGTDYNGITQEFTVTPASGSVTVAGDKSKLAIKVASNTAGDNYAVKLTFTKDKKVSEFKFTVINKKQQALKDELMLRAEVKKTLAAAVDKLKEKHILFDAVEKKFVIQNSADPEFFFTDFFKKNEGPYKDMEREITVTPAGGSISKDVFGGTDKVEVGYAKDPKNGDTFTVMYTFKKNNKVSEFKFTFVNMRKKVYDKNQIKGQIARLVQDLNGDQGIWTSTKKYMYQYKDKNKAIRLPKKGDKDDIKNVALTWGLKKGHEHGARIDKNKDGESIVIIDDAKVNHKVVLTVTVALPGENMVFDELPDASNTNAYLAFSFFIES